MGNFYFIIFYLFFLRLRDEMDKWVRFFFFFWDEKVRKISFHIKLKNNREGYKQSARELLN